MILRVQVAVLHFRSVDGGGYDMCHGLGQCFDSLDREARKNARRDPGKIVVAAVPGKLALAFPYVVTDQLQRDAAAYLVLVAEAADTPMGDWKQAIPATLRRLAGCLFDRREDTLRQLQSPFTLDVDTSARTNPAIAQRFMTPVAGGRVLLPEGATDKAALEYFAAILEQSPQNASSWMLVLTGEELESRQQERYRPTNEDPRARPDPVRSADDWSGASLHREGFLRAARLLPLTPQKLVLLVVCASNISLVCIAAVVGQHVVSEMVRITTAIEQVQSKEPMPIVCQSAPVQAPSGAGQWLSIPVPGGIAVGDPATSAAAPRSESNAEHKAAKKKDGPKAPAVDRTIKADGGTS